MVAYTANKLLALPTVGGDSGVWGTELNDDTITPLDLQLGGVLSIALSATNYTLSAADIEYFTIKLTGALLADLTIYSSNIGFCIVENNTTGSQTITWQTTTAPSGGTPVGSGVLIGQGSRNLLISDMTSGTRRADTSLLAAGTTMLFFQSAAPTGWTQVTSYNDYALRIVNGAGGGTYGTGQAFSSATSRGAVDSHTLTTTEMPVHSHGVTDPAHNHTESTWWASGAYTYDSGGAGTMGTTGVATSSAVTGISIQNAGAGGGHSHGFTGSAIGLNYLDAIVCQKD